MKATQINVYSCCHRMLEILDKLGLIGQKTWAESAAQLTWVGFDLLKEK